MRIACGGTVAVAAYNWINAVMRALGDSKTPLKFLGLASALNILLDLLFVMVLHTGVAGAAIATVASQCISAVSCMIYAFRRMPELKIPRSEMQTDTNMMLLCIKTGLPIAMQSGLISLSMAALQRVTNGFDTAVMSAYTASMRVEQLVQQPFFSLSSALSTFSGQNIGAGETERAERGLQTGLHISSFIAVVMSCLFWVAGGAIIRCFISGAAAVSIGFFALRTTSLCYIPRGSIHVIRGFLNGAGDTGYAMLNGMAEVVCRIGGAVIMTRALGMDYKSIWYTTCLTWFVTGLVGWIRYRHGKWREKAVV
jgi:putative MATE family efflux protein